MKTRYIIALTAAALMFSGCQKSELQDALSGDGIIRFAPRVALSQGADGVESSATKGALINDNANGDYTDIDLPADRSFYATAWTTGASTADFGYTKVLSRGSGAGQYWITVDDSDRDKEYLWKKGQTKTFYAYANLPSYAAVTSALVSGSPVQTLTVTDLPAASVNQADILLGYYTNSAPATSGLVPLKFYHPMTAVLFKKGTIKGTDATVTGISIEGVYTAGTATMTATSMAETDNADKVVWSSLSGSRTVSLSSTSVDDDTEQIGDALILIPQAFASDSEARIIVTLSDGSTICTSLAGKQWKAGYTNTYTIGLERNIIDVSISETFNGKTKSDVSVRNTGTANAYVRAAVVANWVTAEGLVAQPCDLSGLAFNTSDWTLSGGFYYCRKAIRPGSRTPNLFDSFTAPSPKPDESLHVEMAVIAQGVDLESGTTSTNSAKANAAWGITGILVNAIQE